MYMYLLRKVWYMNIYIYTCSCICILVVLFAVGEPLNKEAWKWYHSVVGDGRCTIVDTYWQTGTHHPAPVSTVLHTMSHSSHNVPRSCNVCVHIYMF